jgi:nucleoside 2-deoxyribosyltransferase
MKVYVASPLGFSEAGKHFYYNRLQVLIEESGCAPMFPWDLSSPEPIIKAKSMPWSAERKERLREINKELAKGNMLAIHEADAVVAVLDGMEVDSGTAAEIGYAAAIGKPIIGYRGDYRLACDNEGSMVNMQVEFFVKLNGGDVVCTLEDLKGSLTSMKERFK